jgi:hypothetical protein
MTSWKDALAEGAVSGSIAAVLSAAVVAVAGKRESGSAIAPINAVSHWMWGEEAAQDETVNVRHTGVGAVTQLLAGMFWGTLHALLRPHVRDEDVVPAAIAGGIATSVAAGVLDYGLIPKRLTPGYELRVSNRAIVAAFAAIAVGVAIGTVVRIEAGSGNTST